MNNTTSTISSSSNNSRSNSHSKSQYGTAPLDEIWNGDSPIYDVTKTANGQVFVTVENVIDSEREAVVLRDTAEGSKANQSGSSAEEIPEDLKEQLHKFVHTSEDFRECKEDLKRSLKDSGYVNEAQLEAKKKAIQMEIARSVYPWDKIYSNSFAIFKATRIAALEEIKSKDMSMYNKLSNIMKEIELEIETSSDKSKKGN